MREGKACEGCTGKEPWHAVRHGCYRDSRVQTAAWATMVSFNNWRKTWQRDVDAYVTLTEFARRKFVEAGLPADRIVTKPNCTADPGEPRPLGAGAVYVGRLSREKGMHVLLRGGRSVPVASARRGHSRSWAPGHRRRNCDSR